MFAADVYRVYGTRRRTAGERVLEPLQLTYMRRFRKANATAGTLAGLLDRYLLHRLSVRTQIQIPWCCSIGPGFYIGHLGRVIVSPSAKIGANCNIGTGVTVGAANRGSRKGAPVIGDRVWIGTNAVIVGKVTIGSDVLIAPNAFVNCDVPDHSLVVGNPGVIHHSPRAVEDYINNAS
jgi:serine O-acetyltransferase